MIKAGRPFVWKTHSCFCIYVYIYIHTHVFIGDDRVDRVYDLVSRIRITNIGNPCVNRYRARV